LDVVSRAPEQTDKRHLIVFFIDCELDHEWTRAQEKSWQARIVKNWKPFREVGISRYARQGLFQKTLFKR